MGNRRARAFMLHEQDRAQWERVQTTARDLIKDVTLPGIGIRRVQIVFAPAFEPGFSWDIRVLGAEWRVFRSKLTIVTIENRDETIGLRGYEELEAQGDTLRAYFDRLQGLTLPIGPLCNDSDWGGVDGTDFHLALFGTLNSEIRFRWWSDPPPQWDPLIKIANEMIERFLKLDRSSL